MSGWVWASSFDVKKIESEAKKIVDDLTPEQKSKAQTEIDAIFKATEIERKNTILRRKQEAQSIRIGEGYSDIGLDPTFYKPGIPYVVGYWNSMDPTSVLTKQGFDEQKGRDGILIFQTRFNPVTNPLRLKTYEEYLIEFDRYNKESKSPNWEEDRIKEKVKIKTFEEETRHVWIEDWSQATKEIAIKKFKEAYPLTNEQLYRLLLDNSGQPWMALNQWWVGCPPDPTKNDTTIEYYYNHFVPLRGYQIVFWYPFVDHNEWGFWKSWNETQWWASTNASNANPAALGVNVALGGCDLLQKTKDNEYLIKIAGGGLLVAIVSTGLGVLVGAVRK